MTLPVGRYELTTTSDDGVRLLVDGVIAIDRRQEHTATAVTRTMDLVGRDHDFTLEYHHRAGVAECRLSMKRIL